MSDPDHSHSRFAHLSLPAAKEVKARFPEAQFLVGLGLTSCLCDSGVENVTEMDWWEDAATGLQKAHIENSARLQGQQPAQVTRTAQEGTPEASAEPLVLNRLELRRADQRHVKGRLLSKQAALHCSMRTGAAQHGAFDAVPPVLPRTQYRRSQGGARPARSPLGVR